MKRIVFILLLVGFVSCKPSWQQVINDLIGRRLSFPESLISYEMGDVTKVSIQDSLNKYGGAILYYFGKEECQTCLVDKIPKWTDELIASLPQVPIVYVLADNVEDAIPLTISKLAPTALILIDRGNSFLKMNSFIPRESFLRSYVLDSERQILLCGSLVGNERLKDLYGKIARNKGALLESEAK